MPIAMLSCRRISIHVQAPEGMHRSVNV